MSVFDGLHLKSVVLPVDDAAVVVTPHAVEEAALDGLTGHLRARMERHRFSALPLRDGRLLVTAGLAGPPRYSKASAMTSFRSTSHRSSPPRWLDLHVDPL